MAEPECVLLIGLEGADHVRLTIFPLLDDPTNNPYATRPAHVRLRAGPFSGAYSTDLRPQELHTFLAELRSLCGLSIRDGHARQFGGYATPVVHGQWEWRHR